MDDVEVFGADEQRDFMAFEAATLAPDADPAHNLVVLFGEGPAQAWNRHKQLRKSEHKNYD